MNLDKCRRNQNVKISSIMDSEVRAQAIRFGIAEGEIVRCMQVIPAGPIIIKKNNQEIAIGRKLAQQILVSEVV